MREWFVKGSPCRSRLALVRVCIALVSIFSANYASAYDGFCRTAADVAELPPRHWCEVPNSQLQSVEKRPNQFSDWNGSSSAQYNSFQRVAGVSAVTHAWGGAAFDSKRNCLLVFGGGHDDYGGNELYSFCLDTLQWTRLSDPTPFPSRHPAFQNSDGTPVSRHTYGGLQYIVGADRFFAYDGAPDDGPGTCGVRGTWTFNLPARASAGSYATSQWELRTTSGEPQGECDNASAFDAVTSNVIFKSAEGTYTYNYSANRWTRVTSSGRRNNQVTIAVDADRRMLVEVGGGTTALWSIDNNFSGGAVSTTGPTNVQGGDNPGLGYDVRLKRIVGWNGGANVYTLDVASRVWSAVTPDAGNTKNPGSVSTVGGVFGRFNYSPSLNVFMYVDQVSDNVFLYRLTDGAPIPTPNAPGALTAN